ncbi:MAG TPA: PhzF family phenazine biosynthesis protein [Acidimicrobiales bacterium]|nr:PhzF family phenazine biosynthesis protein [Acidimicrobiales bacterium]
MRLFQVDAFTDAVFHGNPAAVCLVDRAVDGSWMQAVAAEMNLSETAFVCQGDRPHGLRWFTPVAEVDLCGHATLASAHVLWEAGERAARIEFATRSGVLRATRRGRSIDLDFPALASVPEPAPPGLADALGTEPLLVARSRDDLLVEVADASTVRELAPDVGALTRVEARGVIVTAAEGAAAVHEGADFVSRFFAPRVGIDEDPVTGSAHCALAPFWSVRLGRHHLVGYQASRRGGVVGVRVAGDRVVLTGDAVTVLSAELH